MSVNFFMCLGHEIKHSISRQELPLEILDIAPMRKFGYDVFVELPNGDCCRVISFSDNVISYIADESSGEIKHINLNELH